MIDFELARWNMVDLPLAFESAAVVWFETHCGAGYDLLGNLQFVLAPVAHLKRRWFRSEAVAAALGIPDPWRYAPATLASTLRLLQPAPAGFFSPTERHI